MRYHTLVGLVALSLATATLAQGARSNIGVLTCTLSDAEGAGRNMTCGFKATGSAREEKYVGNIRGRDQTLPTGKLVLIWTVLGPSESKLPPAVLAQRFTKVKSAAGEPPTLTGEANSAIVLQFETNNPAKLSDAITELELKLAATPV